MLSFGPITLLCAQRFLSVSFLPWKCPFYLLLIAETEIMANTPASFGFGRFGPLLLRC